ncbi:MAG: transporter, partial [Muribaculaceae bacterium]
MRQFLKTWMLPIAMLGGALFHDWIENIKFLTPLLIFLMLTVTYTRIKPQEFRITRFHWSLLLVQLIGCWIIYFALYYLNPIIAAGGFICVFISTATAAPVITGMLGGSISRIATYSFLSNLMVALFAPFFLTFINHGENIPFIESFQKICSEVLPILILPIIVALILRYSFPKLHLAISNHQSISFYMWAIALFIVVGTAVSFILKQPIKSLSEMIGLGVVSLIACCLQFYIGR